MNGIDKRKHHRVDSTNLLSYVCLDENSKPFTQGMGRTLNVSESGIQLETHAPIDPETVVSLTIGIGEDLVDILGEVVYLKKSGEDTYEAGINFSVSDATKLNILRKFIAAFEGK